MLLKYGASSRAPPALCWNESIYVNDIRMITSATSIPSDIETHIEKHLGAIANVYRSKEGGSTDLRIGHVLPTDTRPVHTLVTCGMSGRPMSVPKPDMPAYMELMMTLPREWKLGAELPEDERWSWPVHLLAKLAGRAHEEGGWLGWGHLIPNGDPPQPYAHSTKQCASLIVPSLLVPTAFYELATPQKTIVFYAVVPLYKEEYDLGRRSGTDALFTRLIDGDVNDVIDPNRRNVARKRFWLFG